jgi:hypothetical protein
LVGDHGWFPSRWASFVLRRSSKCNAPNRSTIQRSNREEIEPLTDPDQ